jgi:ribonuclease III
MNDERRTTLKTVEERLDYRFRDLALLDQALTHRSFAHEIAGSGVPDNERLEFLGDAVLDLCISDLLMRHFPEDPEGRLSKKRASCVNERALAELARFFHLGDGLLLGRGEEISGGRTKASLLANAMEAVVAAVYLDGGFERTMAFIRRFFGDLIHAGSANPLYQDYKTFLQEVCQSRFHAVPKYSVIQERGPDHDKTFEVLLDVSDGITTSGIGKSRKEAEQEAAGRALERLGQVRTMAATDQDGGES